MEQAMETRPGVPQNGGNGFVFDRPRSKRDPVHREGSGIPQNEGSGPPTVETGVLLIGRGVAYRKTEETDLCWRATVETGVLFIGRGVAYRKMGLHGILFISTVDCLHVLLFIHRRPPPASTCDCSSTGSCSSSLHRVLLHRLLFNQPSPRAPVQPPLHGLLFIQPSTVYCSSSPPRGGPVHPALHGVLFIQPQPARTIGVLFIHPHRELFIQTPQQRSLFIQRQHRSALVSSSSKGIARPGSVNSHRSIGRVQ